MLSPRYLDGLSDDLVEIYSRLETDILQDMARRISRLGKITDATKWQAQMLAEVGGLKRNISRILAKYDKTIVEQVKKAFSDALETNAKNDNRIFKEAIGRTVSTPNAQAMLSTIQKCHSDLSRLTLTTASTTQEQFVREANRVYMNVQSGAFDYDTAMKDAANSLAKRGITTVQYENGKPIIRTIESAVRMNILTSINQTAANQTLNNCEELECDLVETSAHVGSRPEHEEWQGQIFSMSGTNKKYRPFSVCELGSATGICGINCRHSFYPYFEGTQKHYTQDDLDEMANKKVKFNGKEMTRYEGEQKLRGIERNIRAYKRQAVTQEAVGVDNTKARAKLGEWQAVARDFTKQTGIQRDSAREWIGTGGKPQPAAISPQRANYAENLKKAQQIKRLDRAKNKVVAETAQGSPMNFKKADGLKPNPNYTKGGGYTNNCQTSVVAYELRRRGYDVEALANYKGSMLNVLSHDTSLAWVDRATGKKPAYITPAQPTIKKSFEWIKNEIKTQNRYTIEFEWKSGSCGHIVHLFKNADNILQIYDPQCGEIYRTDNAVLEYLKRVRPTTIKLLDVQNYDINLNVVNKILRGAK